MDETVRRNGSNGRGRRYAGDGMPMFGYGGSLGPHIFSGPGNGLLGESIFGDGVSEKQVGAMLDCGESAMRFDVGFDAAGFASELRTMVDVDFANGTATVPVIVERVFQVFGEPRVRAMLLHWSHREWLQAALTSDGGPTASLYGDVYDALVASFRDARDEGVVWMAGASRSEASRASQELREAVAAVGMDPVWGGTVSDHEDHLGIFDHDSLGLATPIARLRDVEQALDDLNRIVNGEPGAAGRENGLDLDSLEDEYAAALGEEPAKDGFVSAVKAASRDFAEALVFASLDLAHSLLGKIETRAYRLFGLVPVDAAAERLLDLSPPTDRAHVEGLMDVMERAAEDEGFRWDTERKP
jgi:hypothetical protein